ncbi:aldehyde dehydrogenase family protein [Paenibacillus sp. LMG 31456]|uniref:Aldehyde dehydrogenase family protein n=1 Tax=Paenibacillus foliorum TaxID=2654974 RepID=A0A972K2R3_9BACL|nr:aldehyde dehydrogenase family protein [Paenibacillus foliorum]NOU94132.1 aldehyde dehydrogenase family protein [Paenibacillus foliorum]
MNKGIFIDGHYVGAKRYYELFNPYSGTKLADVALSSPLEMTGAIASAQEGFNRMRSLPAHRRAEILYRTAELYRQKRVEAARILSEEAAKPISAARVEIDRAIQTLLFSAEEAKRVCGENVPMDAAVGGEGRYAFTIRQPIGVIGAITPFNFPLNLLVHKVGPALAAGNSIVVKPAEQTPLSAFYLAELLTEAGAPQGAISIVTGEGPVLGKVLLSDERIRKISFTGSPEVGIAIKSMAGLKKITLELGSNSALYIDKSVRDQLLSIVKQAAHGAFGYSGQVCISTQRIYVHQELYPEFIQMLSEEINGIPVGDPLDEQTVVTSLINPKSQSRIISWVKEAIAEGAKVLTGGFVKDGIMLPTLLTSVTPSMKVSCQEVFGPVVMVHSVTDSCEAVSLMNRSRYGLNAGVFTNDLIQAMQMSTDLEVGQVLVNDIPSIRFDHMPYGGLKDSGYGLEGVKYAVEEMTNLKLISLRYQI